MKKTALMLFCMVFLVGCFGVNESGGGNCDSYCSGKGFSGGDCVYCVNLDNVRADGRCRQKGYFLDNITENICRGDVDDNMQSGCFCS